MARVIVACPHCKARFDVSTFKPGSKIRCGSCYKILVIPDRGGGQTVRKPVKRTARKGAPARRKARPEKKVAEAPAEDEPARKPAAREARKPAAAVKEKTPPAPGADEPAPDSVETKTVAPGGLAAKSGDPLIGTRINDEFEIVRKLGQGGYGTVYEAVDLSLKRRVAVKLMLKEKTTNKEFVAKFLREARTAAQLSHPNIVKIHLVSFCKELQQHFLAMEYVEGQTLSDIMSDEGAFPVERGVDVLIQSANGLAEAHRKNIIHRDIKPGNIMINPKGVVKITDFGLAKIYDPDDAASMVIGTPYFMPPEQFEGKARDGRTDIYALGVTLYFMLTLKRPFDGKTPAQVLLNVMQKQPASPRELNPDIPEALCDIIFKMIERKLSKRYSSCEELLRDVKGLKAEHGEEAVFCPNCGLTNSFTATKCDECGTSLLEPCPKCGAPDSIGAKFCGNCGANLAKERQVSALLKEAQAHESAGRIEDALDKYREAKEAAPENTQAIEGLRRAEHLQSEREDIAANIRRLLDDDKFVEAHTAAEEAAERFPDHRVFGELLEKAREGAKEERLTSGLAEVKSLLAAGDLAEACNAARAAIEIDPSSETAQKMLQEAELSVERHAEVSDRAASLEEKGHLGQAMEAWREVLELMPVDTRAREAVERIEGVVQKTATCREQAAAALDTLDFDGARRALAEAARLIPSDEETHSLLSRLRSDETGLREGVASALDLFAAGEFEEGISGLETLGERYPGSRRVEETTHRARELVEIGDKFLEDARVQLDEGQPEMANRLVRLARGILGPSTAVEELTEAVEQRSRRQIEVLAGVRGMLERGDFEQAAAELEPLGGICSGNEQVAELAIAAAAGFGSRTEDSRDRRTELLQNAIRTARDLLEAGQYHAAKSATQKALRIDRHNKEARELRREIDSSLEAIEQAGGDSHIETGFFKLDGLEDEI